MGESLVLDEQDRRLLNLLQSEFPLQARPFAALGAKLGASEEEVLARVRHLKEEKLIRQISAIFDSYRLGYKSSLVAVRTAPGAIEAVAAVINAHPGVSHNYERNHDFNLWFTITIPPHLDLKDEVKRLQAESGALSMRLLPTLRLFKIGVRLDMAGDESVSAPKGPAEEAPAPPPLLGEADIAAIRALQRDLPLVLEPFAELAQQAGMGEVALIAEAERFLATGQMRRFAAVLHHRRAGFVANGMGVWSVPAERIEAVGQKMASYAAVSHCYYRPSYPDWPYNLFTMVHGKSTDECEKVAASISAETGITDYAVLYSTREFKKVRVRYFEW